MIRRATVLAVALGALAAAPLEASTPPCPLVTSNFNFFAPCRLGHFTITDWLWDDSDVPGNPPPFSSIVLQLFDDHLDMTVVGGDFSYLVDPTQWPGNQPFTFTELRFLVGIQADNPATAFFATAVRSNGSGLFNLPSNAFGYANVGAKFTQGTGFGFPDDLGCFLTGGLGPQACPMTGSSIRSFTPQLGSGVFGTGWATGISYSAPSVEAASAYLYNQSWTASLYFSAPSVVPEPETWALMATGLVGIGAIAWRRRRIAA